MVPISMYLSCKLQPMISPSQFMLKPKKLQGSREASHRSQKDFFQAKSSGHSKLGCTFP
jgi:hypothetical protein